MTMHFEELWVLCEKMHQEAPAQSTVSEVLQELVLKTNFYKTIEESQKLPPEEMQQFRFRAMGEVLLVLTHLSLKDNINVFDALHSAMQYRSTENQTKKKLKP